MVLYDMKIIGFVGSPHRDGNTAAVVNAVLDGARKMGAETQIFYASEMRVETCRGCRACMNKKGCIINDDMKPFFDAFKTCDGLVFGSPNYMGQMSGQAKTFLDRLSPYIVPKFSPKFNPEYANKKLVLVFTQGNPDANKFKTYYDYTREMFEMLSFKTCGTIVLANTREHDAARLNQLNPEIEKVVRALIG